MILAIDDIAPEVADTLKKLATVYPFPQLSVWEGLAKRLYDQGKTAEACYTLDLTAKPYGKDVARHAAERVTRIPAHLKGRGIPAAWHERLHPASTLLCDHTLPLRLGTRLYLRHGMNAVGFAPDDILSHAIHLFDDTPTQTGFAGIDPIQPAIQWIALDGCVLWSRGDHTLHLVDTTAIDENLPSELASRRPLPHATLTFDTHIRKLSGPIQDGTFFVTLASTIPILSDECRLCALDLHAIRHFFDRYPGEPCDIRQLQALRQDIALPNIQQTLDNDCAPNGDTFITCGGGMQPSEIRFIAPNGAWTTKFAHQHPVLAIIPSAHGIVSLDASGLALLWNGTRITDDARFALHTLPDDLQSLRNTTLSIDWPRKHLYVTRATPHRTLSDVLNHLQAFRLDAHSATPNFLLHVFPGLALTSDGTFHFWSDAHGSVDMQWQLADATANSDDWRELLAIQSPSIEEDPRIRIIR